MNRGIWWIVAGLLVSLGFGGCGDRKTETKSAASPDTLEKPYSYPNLPVRGTFLADRRALLDLPEKTVAVASSTAEDQTRIDALIQELRELNPERRAASILGLAGFGSAALRSLVEALSLEGRLDFERVALLDAVGVIGDPAANETLLRLLSDDESPIVRASSAVALAQIGDSSLLPNLILRLKYEKDGFVVNAICATLHKMGLAAGIDKLLANLEGRIRLREEAAEVLQNILGKGFVFDPWSIETERSLAARKMRMWWWQHGEETLLRLNRNVKVEPALEAKIIDTVFELAKYQMRNVDDGRYILEGLGPVAVPYLCLGIRDENQYVRAHCVETFVRMGRPGEDGKEALRESVGDVLLRPDIVRAMGRLHDLGSRECLVAAFDDPAIDVRICAVDSIGQIGEASDLQALVAAGSNPIDSNELKIALAFARALLGDESLLPDVIRILDSKAPVGLWDLAARTDRLLRVWSAKTGSLPEGYPFEGAPEEKTAYLREALLAQ